MLGFIEGLFTNSKKLNFSATSRTPFLIRDTMLSFLSFIHSPGSIAVTATICQLTAVDGLGETVGPMGLRPVGF